LSKDRVLLITGPSGAGKSTVAEEWANAHGENAVQLSLDSFREFVKSGFRDPGNGWNDETQRQLDLARANIAAVASNYSEADFQVVVDDAVFPNWDEVGIERWREALSPLEIDLVALLPSWDAVLERNAARASDRKLPEAMLRTIYDDMSGWRRYSDVNVIDNSEFTVAQTLAEIERLLTI
jgi:chloramphenicol 3-O-phosphotransferase